ncbi:hypothetical protein [Bacillus sp. UNC41MFS5]|uniref:hypothetical protein n=1 Tax=Bacillus sp. UNC41MFS5 TaxID=1449046 RepID=UPI000A57245F|nr:hypothetical protein [Bacillus sp. UNC41MFS5]
MIWLYIFSPVVILGAIAFYFDKKSGAAPSDDSRFAEKLEEYPPENNNIYGP